MEHLFDWQAILTTVRNSLDLIIVFLVFAGGFFQGTWLKKWALDPTYKTLICSTVLVLLYLVAFSISNTYDRTNVVKWFLSYAAATSLYELGVKYLFAWIAKILPGNKEEKPKP